MIDVKKYIEKKAKGLSAISKVGDAYAVSFKKFDVETGAQLDPEVLAVDVTELETKKKELQQEITEIDSLIADVKAL